MFARQVRDASPFRTHGVLPEGNHAGFSDVSPIAGGSSIVMGAPSTNDYPVRFNSRPHYACPADFTIEGLMRWPADVATDSTVLFVVAAAFSIVRTAASQVLQLRQGSTTRIAGTGTVGNGIVQAFALARSGTTLSLYLAGDLQGTWEYGDAIPDNALMFGYGGGGGGQPMPAGAELDELRLTVGIDRYAGDYTPDHGELPEGALDPHWSHVALLAHGDAVPAMAIAPQRICRLARIGEPDLGARPVIADRTVFWQELVNREHGGFGYIEGTVKNEGSPRAPVFRRVRLTAQRSGIFVAETWSDPVTGYFRFDYLKEGILYVVDSFDHTGNYRGVTADRLPATPMPQP